MKKIMLLFLGVVLITGCSNSKEKELCEKIDEIDVKTYTSSEMYDDLTLVLEDNFKTYCENTDSSVCNVLSEYIEATKSEVKTEDCSTLEGNLKDLCESNNKLAKSSKVSNITYMHEEFWAACNK